MNEQESMQAMEAPDSQTADRKRTGQFVCYALLEFPAIVKEYADGENSEKKFYHNVKFVFHGWYKSGSTRTYIIASNEFTLRSEELLKFLSCWHGAPLLPTLYRSLTADRLRKMAIGQNAILDYAVGNGPTRILRIAPANTGKTIVPIKGLQVPSYLVNRPVRLELGEGFGSLAAGGSNE